jgi:ABC-2 type transport system permease protein
MSGANASPAGRSHQETSGANASPAGRSHHETSGSFFLSTSVFWRREIVRFLRQRSRIIGALGTPVIFWLLLGFGVGDSFSPAGQSLAMRYQEYFFPGTVVLILLFTAIFSTISIIEDRKEGFLQAVLVAPVPRSAFVFGKLLGGTSLAFMQGVLFMLLAPVVGVPVSSIPVTLLLLALVAFSLTALGYIIAWRMDSTQGFHAIMNLLLIPMWLLCGAVFPASGAPGWLRAVIAVNPLTYGLSAVRWSIYGNEVASTMGLPGFALSVGVTVVFGALMFGAAIAMTRRPA